MSFSRLPGHPLVWLSAATLTGLTNSVQVAPRLDEHLRVSSRLLVHLYDLGLFVAIGLCAALLSIGAALARRLGRFTERSFRFWLLFSMVGGVLGALILSRDLDSFVVRHHIPVGPVTFGAALGAIVYATLGLGDRWVRGWLTRSLLLVLGLGVAWGNAELLRGDYRGTHFFASLVATHFFARSTCPWLSRVSLRYPPWALLGAFITTCLVFLVAPRDSVRQGLTVSSGSSVFPLVPHLMARPTRRVATPLPIEKSAWFRDRTKARSLPATKPGLLPKHPAVIYLTLEALRKDVIDDPELARRLPNLAHIRDRALWFTDARTPCPSTATVMTSLFTGKYYSQIYYKKYAPGVVVPTPDKSPRVPSLLETHGVSTSHVVAYRSLMARHGVGRGFGRERTTRSDFGRAPEVMRLVLEELERYRAPRSRPLFLMAHFLDSHAPYKAAGVKKTDYLGYMAGLNQIDREIGRLLRYLKDHNLENDVLLVIGADHGEAFGEHGMSFHGRNIYDELMRIPLMFYAPFVSPGRVKEPVTTLDLSPTFLDLFGARTPGSFMGQSLVPHLMGRNVTLERPIAADSGRRKQSLVFPDGIKVILDRPSYTIEVYDLHADPKELHNLTDDASRNFDAHIATTERFFQIHVLRIPGWEPPWRRS